MKEFLTESLVITASFLSVFFWQQSDLAVYTVPLLGILTSFYLVTVMRKKSVNKTNHVLVVFLLNTSSLLLIHATGGLHSLLFFLLYFLAFYIGFMLKAETVFIFTACVIFFFLQSVLVGDTLANATKIISFLLLSPLAYFFGKETLLREKEIKELTMLKEEAEFVTEQIIQDVSDVVKNEGKSLKEEDIAALQDIVEQSRELKKEAA